MPTVAPGQVFDFAVNMEKAVAFDSDDRGTDRALMQPDIIIIGSGMGGRDPGRRPGPDRARAS